MDYHTSSTFKAEICKRILHHYVNYSSLNEQIQTRNNMKSLNFAQIYKAIENRGRWLLLIVYSLDLVADMQLSALIWNQ